jgi:fibro-slime domain-containing protein
MNVTADDDLWIFINGALALDLGGTHPPTGASINFDTLGLSAGELYTIDLFFAERHTTQSELSIATNVTAVPEPSTIALGGLASLGAGLCWWRRRK